MNNTPVPSEICEEHPILTKYGFYRRLNDGRLEFASFCSPESRRWLSIHEIDLENILNETLHKDKTLTILNDLARLKNNYTTALRRNNVGIAIPEDIERPDGPN